MPLYDVMLLVKPNVVQAALMDLVQRVGKHVYRRNGVITDVKSFGTVQLGYAIKKLDGKYFQGQMLQMTMMTPPNFNSELHYLNKEDRLLRWLLIKNRGVKFGLELFNDNGQDELRSFQRSYDDIGKTNQEDDDDDDDDYEFETEQSDAEKQLE